MRKDELPDNEPTSEDVPMDTAPVVALAGENPGEAVDPKQQMLLTVLVGNPDVAAAAKAAGVSRRTAYRWLQMPGFRNELARQRDAVLAEALAGVRTHVTRAVAGLGKLLDTQDERVRRMVCNDILDRAMKIHEMENIERRISVIEAALEQKDEREGRK